MSGPLKHQFVMQAPDRSTLLDEADAYATQLGLTFRRIDLEVCAGGWQGHFTAAPPEPARSSRR